MGQLGEKLQVIGQSAPPSIGVRGLIGGIAGHGEGLWVVDWSTLPPKWGGGC